jgi:hypothetical protein
MVQQVAAAQVVGALDQTLLLVLPVLPTLAVEEVAGQITSMAVLGDQAL